MGKSIISMRARSPRTTPSLIETMSFQLAIPWQGALPQSLPPLHQPAPILQEKAFGLQCNSSER
jgi:transposase